MAKKAKKVSWRTLARQAKKEKRPAEALWLRRKSAALRRADRKKKVAPPARQKDRVDTVQGKLVPFPAKRMPATRGAKAWATRRANQMAKATGTGAKPSEEAWQATNQAMAEDKPGHGEIVGGADAQLAERLVALARKKGGKDAVQNEITVLRVASDKAATARLVESHQILADRVVCGFIAEVDHSMKFYRGLPPDQTWMLNSFLITKIVDALNKAGYRATGKT